MSKKKSKNYSKALSVDENIKELLEQGFIERVKSNGSAYFVITKKGLEFYERLSKSPITFIADLDIDEPTKH